MKQAKVLSEAYTKRVLAAISGRKTKDRDRVMFMLTLLAGMRAGEVATLKVSDVFEFHGSVRDHIRLSKDQTKGDEARTVLLNAQLQSELSLYGHSSAAPKEGVLFLSHRGHPMRSNSVVQIFGRIYAAAKLRNASSHSGRRTFITLLAHKGVNVRVLAALAGHKNISTTQRYIELNDNVLRSAVELL